MSNEVIKALLERRSIRKFKSDAVPKEKLERIIEAGLYAPSGMNHQSAKIIAVTNKEMRDKISRMNAKILGKEDIDPFYGAPVILIVVEDANWEIACNDGSLVIGNLLNATHAESLGGVWIHRAKEEFETEEGKEILKNLGIEGKQVGIGHCAIGYIDGEVLPASPRKPNRVYWIE